MNKNKIKKLDNEYKKHYLNDLRQETRELWRLMEYQGIKDSKACSCHHDEDAHLRGSLHLTASLARVGG